MNQRISWEDRIKGAYAVLRPSEQKVADAILRQSGEVPKMTIGQLAEQAGVSEPTVIRCVRALGFRGYREFKDALRQRFSVKGQRGGAFDHLGGFELRIWERVEDLPLKALSTHREMLGETLKAVSAKDLEAAVAILAGARLVDIYSVENSCAPASDLLTKLTYLGLACRMNTDAYLQQIGAAHLARGDAAVAFSHSGRSADTVKALRLAQKTGAATIAVCSKKNGLLGNTESSGFCFEQKREPTPCSSGPTSAAATRSPRLRLRQTLGTMWWAPMTESTSSCM